MGTWVVGVCMCVCVYVCMFVFLCVCVYVWYTCVCVLVCVCRTEPYLNTCLCIPVYGVHVVFWQENHHTYT